MKSCKYFPVRVLVQSSIRLFLLGKLLSLNMTIQIKSESRIIILRLVPNIVVFLATIYCLHKKLYPFLKIVSSLHAGCGAFEVLVRQNRHPRLILSKVSRSFCVVYMALNLFHTDPKRTIFPAFLIVIYHITLKSSFHLLLCLASSVIYVMDWGESFQSFPVPTIVGLTLGANIDHVLDIITE